jgi:hypothetical protein
MLQRTKKLIFQGEQKGIVRGFSIFLFDLRDATKFKSGFSVSAWLYKKPEGSQRNVNEPTP